MEAAVANAEAKGVILPSYDPLNYPGKHYVRNFSKALSSNRVLIEAP